MHPFEKIYCRVFQLCFRLAMPFLPYREPKRLKKLEEIVPVLKERGLHHVLIVTDAGLRQTSAFTHLADILKSGGIVAAIYDRTRANPTVQNVEEAKELYRAEACQAIIAFGGGSAMDCAKAAAALVRAKFWGLRQLAGLLKVWHAMPPFFAIPTTAGTGSEVTLTAVITDPARRHKYTMNSFPLIPHYAVLDPAVTVSLPAHLTATTGMDALTHAVEAYIGGSTTRETRRLAREAVALVFTYLPKAYRDGGDLEAREKLLEAAYKAGIAFSKSYVGYVHAIAHSLGGEYNIPHGLANAVLLPKVLRAYGRTIDRQLAELARAANVDGDFIDAIARMNATLGIPTSFPQIQAADVPRMARHAAAEANPLYPVPVLMTARELEAFYVS